MKTAGFKFQEPEKLQGRKHPILSSRANSNSHGFAAGPPFAGDFGRGCQGIAALLLFFVLCFSTEAEKRNDASIWSHSVVTVEVARKQYDYYQPWSKPMRQVQKVGTVLGGHQILTTANDLFDRTLVRLQKGGRGRWWIGEVVWLDYHANLALITTAEADFWNDLNPILLDRTAAPEGRPGPGARRSRPAPSRS